MQPILTKAALSLLYIPDDFGDLQEDFLSIYILTLTKYIRQDFCDGVLFGKIWKINHHVAKAALSTLWLVKLVLFLFFTERL